MATNRVSLSIPSDIVRIVIVAFENQAKNYDKIVSESKGQLPHPDMVQWTDEEVRQAQSYAASLRNLRRQLQNKG